MLLDFILYIIIRKCKMYLFQIILEIISFYKSVGRWFPLPKHPNPILSNWQTLTYPTKQLKYYIF